MVDIAHKKMKKILFIVLDGLGDEPIPDFQGNTPLEEAHTPFMNDLAEEGECGLLDVSFSGALPTSEEGHLGLFGYDAQKLGVRRGFFTARGAGIETKRDDVALRGNFGTLNEKGEVVDRRAGRIKTKDAKKFIDDLRKVEVEGAEFLIESASDHRLGIVVRGEGLSPQVSDGDPFYSKLSQKFEKIEPLENSSEAEKTARVLNEFLQKTGSLLEDHSLNEKRKKEGLPPANCILLRGASSCREITSFKEKWGLDASCVAGKTLYKEVANSLKMEVLEVTGANGHIDTNLAGKVEKAQKALRGKDFVFLHIKATDSLAEDGDYERKRDFIEKIDWEIKKFNNPQDIFIVITCDHSTCSIKKRHCAQPCPVLFWGGRKDEVSVFSEKACLRGGLGKFPQMKLMENILKRA